MRQVTIADLVTILGDREPPCISLYQPTHRRHPENQQDPIRYRNMLKEIEESLRRKYPTRDVRSFLEPFQALSRDELFWNHRTDALAILRSPERFQIFELQRPVVERVVVAETFYTKPLIRTLQSADRFQVLCLSRESVRLYEGNRDALDPLELGGVPARMADALGEQVTEPHNAVRVIPGGAIHHGTGQKRDQVDIDRDRFFRAVDRAVLELHSRPSGLPLILAALTEHHAPFREISHNPFLLADGIAINPEAMEVDELRRKAWSVLEPHYLRRLKKLSEDFGTAQAREMGSADLSDVARAAVAGRVATLLVEADRVIPGRIDPATGSIDSGDLADPDVNDILNDLAEIVLRMRGDVVIVPAERMPTKTGLAATYRY